MLSNQLIPTAQEKRCTNIWLQGVSKSKPDYYCNDFVYCQSTFIFLAHMQCMGINT